VSNSTENFGGILMIQRKKRGGRSEKILQSWVSVLAKRVKEEGGGSTITENGLGSKLRERGVARSTKGGKDCILLSGVSYKSGFRAKNLGVGASTYGK